MGIEQSAFTIFSGKSTVTVNRCQYQSCSFRTGSSWYIIILLIDIQSLRTVEIAGNKNFVAFHSAHVDILFDNTAAALHIFSC